MLVARACPLLWLLLCCHVERTVAGKKKKDEDADKKVAVPHHSFQIPLRYEEVLRDWVVSGASLVERERVLLHPSVPERAAFLWNKAPLLTNDFEATVHFRVIGPKDGDALMSDQSFALWYVQENVTAGYNETKLIKAPSWKAGLEEMGMTFSGFKSKYNGFGAILSTMDAQKKPKAVVSGIWNDGDRELVYGKDAPSSNSKAVDFRNTMNAAQLRLRVSPTSIVGYLKQSPSLSWNECFKIDRTKDPVKPGGYIGFTAWSGSASSGKVPDLISFTQFEVNNYDTTSIGEDMKDVSSEIQEAYRSMLTDDNRHFHDQKSQSEHIDRLVQMLSQHAEASRPAEEKMYQDLEVLQGRMSKLDEDCKLLVKELKILVTPDGDSGAEVALKDEIIGLRRLFIKDSASHRQKLEVVQKNVAEVKQKHVAASKPDMFNEVAMLSESVETTVARSSTQTLWMLILLVGAVAIIGYLMWNRMQYYERKHFL